MAVGGASVGDVLSLVELGTLGTLVKDVFGGLGKGKACRGVVGIVDFCSGVARTTLVVVNLVDVMVCLIFYLDLFASIENVWMEGNERQRELTKPKRQPCDTLKERKVLLRGSDINSLPREHVLETESQTGCDLYHRSVADTSDPGRIN